MMGRGYGFGGGFGMIGLIFMVVGWLIGLAMLAGYIWMFVKVVRLNKLMKHGGFNGKSTLEIVNERYAKGEIDQKEFLKLSSDLRKSK